jgi:hypothetical protein
MKDLLEKINSRVIDSNGVLNAQQAGIYRTQYRKLIQKGELELPEPLRPNKKAKGIKASHALNLLFNGKLQEFLK